MEQYEINWKDYYAALGVHTGAEPEVVRAAYAAMARKYHPDTGGSDRRMKDINEAYEVLGDPAKKEGYDAFCCQRQASSGAHARDAGGARSTYRDDPPRDGAGGAASRGSYRRPEPAPSAPPPERPGILPWPSLAWQKVALFCSIPLGIALMAWQLSLWVTAAGLFILVAACYAAVKTRGLSMVGTPWNAARVSAGFCITATLCVLAAAALALAVVTLAVLAVVAIVKR